MKWISALCLLAIGAVGCGDGLTGYWKTEDARNTLSFTESGDFRLWDAQFPPSTLASLDPMNNPDGAKIYGTYRVANGTVVVTGHDGLYPLASVPDGVTLSSTYRITDGVLTAPGFVQDESRYLSAPGL